MNIEYAQTLPLPEILCKLGLEPAQQKNDQLLYFSPFSNAPEPTLQISLSANSWLDTKNGGSGHVVDFISAWLAHHHLKCSDTDALHWLKFNIGYPSLLSFMELPDDQEQNRQFAFRYKTLLLERSLVRYVESLGIPAGVARKFLKQVYVLNKATGKEFLAIGLKNEEGGYAIRSPYLKGNIAPVAITFIRGLVAKPHAVHIFKNVFDYLIALINRDNEPFGEDCIILNSYGCMDNAAAYIRGYGYRMLYTWFDDSKTGQQARTACRFLASTEPNLKHVPMEQEAPAHD